ncbi:MAG TPA: hypothetical protein VGL27_11240 [Negativicutes bacterium]|jgi:hypothetical protein
MAIRKMPPLEKVYEAYSAIADDRIVIGKESAAVLSSDYSKKYLVTWQDGVYTSNDSASYWQGYSGYPMIAVLMLQGKLPLEWAIAGHFKGINWKKLNAEHKANYVEAVAVILDDLRQNGVDCDVVNAEVEKVYEKLKTLDIKCKRSSVRPPR